MADPLATAGRLRAFLELEASELTDERAEPLLQAASGEVIAYCGHGFTLETNAVRVYDGSGSTVLLLAEQPLLAVHRVSVGPRSAREDLVEDTDYEWSADGMLRRLNGWRWPLRFGWVEIDVDHGYPAVPDDVAGVVVRVAARGITNPEGLTQETTGGYQAGYGQDDTRLCTLAAPDRRALNPYRLAP